MAHSLTLVKNQDSLLPLKELEKINLATVTISQSGTESYGATTDLYTQGDHFTLSRTADPVSTIRIAFKTGQI